MPRKITLIHVKTLLRDFIARHDEDAEVRKLTLTVPIVFDEAEMHDLVTALNGWDWNLKFIPTLRGKAIFTHITLSRKKSRKI